MNLFAIFGFFVFLHLAAAQSNLCGNTKISIKDEENHSFYSRYTYSSSGRAHVPYTYCNYDVSSPAGTVIEGTCHYYLPSRYSCYSHWIYINGMAKGSGYLWKCNNIGSTTFTTKSNTLDARFFNRYNRYDRWYGIYCKVKAKCASKPDSRIVNGEETNFLEHPYFVGMITAGSAPTKIFCGASLISDQYVLTAAHCVTWLNGQTSKIRLVTGSHSMGANCKTSYRVVEVSKVISHESYNSRTVQNDIALLKLKNKMSMGQSTKTIRMYRGSTFPGSRNVVVTGWGRTSHNGNPSITLQDVTLKTITNSYCNTFSGYKNKVSAGMICTWTKGKDACQGDSGGPMVWNNNGRRELVGIVSWGVGCGTNPGVFTRIEYYQSWINNKMSSN